MGMLHHAGGDAAEEDTADRTQPFRSGHNQVCLILFSHLQNLVSRLPQPQGFTYLEA
jgi:hypothetical protein